MITFQEFATAVLLSLKKQAAVLVSLPSWRVRVKLELLVQQSARN